MFSFGCSVFRFGVLEFGVLGFSGVRVFVCSGLWVVGCGVLWWGWQCLGFFLFWVFCFWGLMVFVFWYPLGFRVFGFHRRVYGF